MRRTLQRYVRTPWAAAIGVWGGSTTADAEAASVFCAKRNMSGLLIAIATIYNLDGGPLLLIACTAKHWKTAVTLANTLCNWVSRSRVILANTLAAESPSTLVHTCTLLVSKWERSRVLASVVAIPICCPVESIAALQTVWPTIFNRTIVQMLSNAVLSGRPDVVYAVSASAREEMRAVARATSAAHAAGDQRFIDAVAVATRRCTHSDMAMLIRTACHCGSHGMLVALIAMPVGRAAAPLVLGEASDAWRAWEASIRIIVGTIQPGEVTGAHATDCVRECIEASNGWTHPLHRAMLSRNNMRIATAMHSSGCVARPHTRFLSECNLCGGEARRAEVATVHWPKWVKDSSRCLYPAIWPSMIQEKAWVVLLCAARLRVLPPELISLILLNL